MGFEVNFDSIVGPTHHYGGLSYGNVASMEHQYSVSNPKAAALQGLEKMKFLHDQGVKQGVLPPHERPDFQTLRSLGFLGSDSEVLKKASEESPELFIACCSAASMWSANAATITPSADSTDGRVHITPANLSTYFHRSIEHRTTTTILKKIFPNPSFFKHHEILPESSYFSDEGAANHNRFCSSYEDQGIQLYVYGRQAFRKNTLTPHKFPARQTLEASQAIARIHQTDPDRVIFAQQNPVAIDAGVFHNDVISVANETVFFYHELAFVDTERVITEIQDKLSTYCHIRPILIQVPTNRISLEEVVSSYLFNSQIVTLDNRSMLLLAPIECETSVNVKKFLGEIVQNPENPIQTVHFINLRESMANGGGPACLRLRVVLTSEELHATNQNVLMNQELYEQIKGWINRHYRDRLLPSDLSDPQLFEENRRALDELTQILHLGVLYDFQH